MLGKNVHKTLLLTLALLPARALAWHPDSTWVFNVWEASVSNGSSLNDPGDMRGGYASIWQLALYHRFTPEEFGPQLPLHYFPEVGVSLTYSDFSHTNVYRQPVPEETYRGNYGHFLSLAISFSHYHYTFGSRRQWRLRSLLENGFAWAFNPYHYPDGMGNTIGGNFQIYFHTGLYLGHAWGHHELAVGPEFTHFSNSGTYLPNGGVNNVSLGVRYRTLAQTELPHTPKAGYRLDEFEPSIYSEIYASIGIHGEGERGDKAEDHSDIAVYGQLNLSYARMYRYTPVAATGVGIDYFSGCRAEELFKPWVGLSINHDTHYKDFAISTVVGIYLNGHHKKGRGESYTRIYEKIGLKYHLPFYFSNFARPYVSYYIKGNEFYAEQFELGFGFTFSRRYRTPFLRRMQKRWAEYAHRQE